MKHFYLNQRSERWLILAEFWGFTCCKSSFAIERKQLTTFLINLCDRRLYNSRVTLQRTVRIGRLRMIRINQVTMNDKTKITAQGLILPQLNINVTQDENAEGSGGQTRSLILDELEAKSSPGKCKISSDAKSNASCRGREIKVVRMAYQKKVISPFAMNLNVSW